MRDGVCNFMRMHGRRVLLAALLEFLKVLM